MHAIRLTYATVYGWLLMMAMIAFALVLGIQQAYRRLAEASKRLRQLPD